MKYHANCLKRMSDQLSETTRVEALQQKRRIKEAVKGLLKKNTQRARDRGDDEPLPKRRMKGADVTNETCTSGCIYTCVS